jgi:hypothetical protein
MRLDGLSAADWQVVTEYMDVLGPLKECTKRLEGRSRQGKYVTVYGVRTSQVPRGGEMVPPHLDQHLLRLSRS